MSSPTQSTQSEHVLSAKAPIIESAGFPENVSCALVSLLVLSRRSELVVRQGQKLSQAVVVGLCPIEHDGDGW